MERIEVTWLDAEQENDWEDQTDLDPPKAKLITRGFKIKEDEDYLYIATTLGIEGNNDCSTFRIPKGCIIKYETK